MKNPKINRLIGYIILFVGFVLFYRGFHYPTENDPVNGHNAVLITVASVMIIGAVFWMVLKVRCPHCNKLLHVRLYNIDICPYCGKRTDI